MRLLLIRHAAAVPRGTPGVADDERPLTADGEAEFRSAAGGLAWIVDPPDVLLSSPLARARATAGIAARTFGRLEPTIEPTLAHGTPETVLTAIAAHGATATTIGVVGHEPLLSAVLARLVGVSDNDQIAFEKGGVALVDLPDGVWAAGRLLWFLEPRILRTLAGRRDSATDGRIRERTLVGTFGAARLRAIREGTTLRWLLLSALRDYASGTWTPRRDAKAPQVVWANVHYGRFRTAAGVAPVEATMNGVRLDGVRVLVVDDTPAVLDVVSMMLVENGASVTAVGTAEAALAVLRRDHPTVLVSDLSMPDKGGYWLIGQVRALSPEDGGATPAAALTGHTSPEHRAGVRRAGFQFHVAKPVGMAELVDVVATLAAGRPSRGVDAASSTR